MKKTTSFTVVYSGKGFSLNKLYEQKHWTVRNKLKEEYSKIFLDLIKERNVKPFSDKFKLYVLYNSRHDVDNISGMAKVFVDTLKNYGYIPEDNKKYYRGMSIDADDNLPTNTFKFKIKRWLQNQ